jgi:hypothetical protein
MARPQPSANGLVLFIANQSGAKTSKINVIAWSRFHDQAGKRFAAR